MDPNVTLSEVRDLIKQLRSDAQGDSNDAEIDTAHRLADAVEALDRWLATGGFLPNRWTS